MVMRSSYEAVKIGAVARRQGPIRFMNHLGHRERFELHGEDPEQAGASLATRIFFHPETQKLQIEEGTISGPIMEGEKFSWQTKHTAAVGGVAVMLIGVSVGSLYKYYRAHQAPAE